jgi:hypothetical protein
VFIDKAFSLQVTESVLRRIPSERQRDVVAIIEHPRSSVSQKRALLAAQGLTRNLIDEIEGLLDAGKFSVLWLVCVFVCLANSKGCAVMGNLQ